MYNAAEAREEEKQEAVLLNDPLKTPQSKVKAEEHVHFEGLLTPPPSSQKSSSTPIVGTAPQFSPYSYKPPLQSCTRMSSAEQPRPAKSSLAPKPFAGAAAETDNAERWLLYLKKYIDYRHLRDDEALALFKLLLVDQGTRLALRIAGRSSGIIRAFGRGVHAEVHTKSSAALSEGLPYVDSEPRTYRIRRRLYDGPEDGGQSNSVPGRATTRLLYHSRLTSTLRMHVLQNQHGTLEEIAHSARVAEIATAGSTDSDKTVAELSRTVSVLVDKLTAKDTAVATPPAATVAAVAMGGADNDRQPRRQPFQSSYNRSGSAPGRQQRQLPQQRYNYQYQDRGGRNPVTRMW
jgi:hypothetical protein